MCKKTFIFSIAFIVGLSFVLLPGCETKSQSGALIGAGAGAGAGALIAGSGNKATGALIGGAIGAGGGYLVGKHMDKKDAEKGTQQYPASDTVTIDVPNSDGTKTSVTLKRSGDGWIGPRGETYSYLPTPEELRATYGR